MNKAMRHRMLVVCMVAVLAPLMLPSQAHALQAIVAISDQSTEVSGGDRLYFNVEIHYPENPARKDMRIEYQIFENGAVVADERVLQSIETESSFLDYLVVPKSINGGTKELRVTVEDVTDAQTHYTTSATFRVVKGQDQEQLYFFVLLGIIALVSVLVVFQIGLSDRKRTS